ncbi:MAG: ribonuclease R, partial [Alistipes sp.]
MIRKNENRTTERQKPVKAFDRKTLITNIFREFPDKKFSLKHLASATGGATKEGRRETGTAVEELTAEGFIEECGFEKFRLTPRNIPHMTGVVDMISTGSMYVRVEGQEKDIFVNQRNSLNALDGDTVDLVLTLKGRSGSPEGEIIRIVERNKKRYV